MTKTTSEDFGRRVLLLAPTARDGQASQRLLRSAGIACELVRDIDELCRQITVGAAVAILPEEMVLADSGDQLSATLREQPVWSDLPLVILSRSGTESTAVEKAMATLGNVSVVERPVRVSTLMSVVRTALRARERQYQVRDYIEQQKKAEVAVREARDIAEAASLAKDRFLAILSHELRTPLSPVVMTVAALQDDPNISQHAREQLAMVQRNVELETKLIDDLLDISRVTTGKLRLRMEPVRIHDLLHHVLDVCNSDLRGKRIDTVTDLSAANDRVMGDPARLRQVFWNLIKNAMKFSAPGSRISVRTVNSTGNKLQVEVTDTGVGIASEALPVIFDAFQQGDPNVARLFGGLGLGLAIARAVVDMHGGTIAATSAGKGLGATFVVEFATVASPQNAATLAPAAQPNRRQALRILLVEDHPDTARVLARLLRSSGHSVKTAGTVASAKQLAEGETFDLLLSDIGLPDATGYDLMSYVHVHFGLKGIALTGYGMDEDMKRGRAVGFSDHMVKPLNYAQLEATIDRVVQPAN